jgi:hypothetical protein
MSAHPSCSDGELATSSGPEESVPTHPHDGGVVGGLVGASGGHERRRAGTIDTHTTTKGAI